MSLSFPLLSAASAALGSDLRLARTLRDAEDLRGAPVTLETEWLVLSPQEARDASSAIMAGLSGGYIQTYEDAEGRTVLAISFWRDAGTRPAGVSARTKPRKKAHDQRQLDLFSGPDQKGYEVADPFNPAVILTEEEGDGASFGGGTAGTATPKS
jgi:hypothetical protein